MPIATLFAGLSLGDAVVFAVGLLVGLVPEGLLPVITLALAVGARDLVRRGAVVKRLSAVETLGSTSVICTDKTGTLTENRMRVTAIWTSARELDLEAGVDASAARGAIASDMRAIAAVSAACNNARLDGEAVRGPDRDRAAARRRRALGVDGRARTSESVVAGATSASTPRLKLMSTVDERDDGVWVDAKGAPEALLPALHGQARGRPPRAAGSGRACGGSQEIVDDHARRGLRVLAVAERRLDPAEGLPERRDQAETGLTLLGLVAMLDPPAAGGRRRGASAATGPGCGSSSSPATMA